MPQINPTVIGKQLILSADAASARTVLQLGSSDSPTFAGLTLTGLQQFTGTSTVGLRVKSLTTAQYNALTATNGDLFLDSTTDRIDARLARGTVELVDTAGGQTINGTLTVGGTLLSTGNVRGAAVWFGGASQANVKLYGTATGQLYVYNSAETAGVMVNVTGNSAAFRNLANNADAPITCSNLTASGTLTLSGLLDLRKAATANILQFSTNTFIRTDTSQLSIFDTGIGRNNISLWRGGNFVIGSSALIAACSNLDSTGGSVDTSLSRASAGVWQIGDGTANALGSLNLNNLSATGTITASQVTGNPTLNIANPGNSGPDACARIGTAAAGLWVAGANYGVRATAGNAATVPFTARGFASQTANLQEWQNSAGTVLASVSPSGDLTASGTITANQVFVGGSGGARLHNNGGGTVEVFQNNGATLGTLTAGACRTNAIQRDIGDVSLVLYNSNFSVAGFCIRGPNGSYLNSSGITGTLHLNPTINQTGTAGSTDFLINRTETVLGSGAHNFADFQVGGVSRFSVSNAGNITASGKITGPASTTALAPLNLPHGVAPTSPVDGDIWTATTGAFVQINGATTQIQKAITSGTAAPSGGVDGDIYLQYV